MVYLLITLQVAHLPQILESTVRYLFKNEKDKEENGGQKKKSLNYSFRILSGPMDKSACVASPLNCSLPPLGSSSNVSHSLGGFCMIASLPPPPATSLIPFFLFLRHPGQSSLPAVNQVWSLQIHGSWAWNVLCLPLSPPGSLLSKL